MMCSIRPAGHRTDSRSVLYSERFETGHWAFMNIAECEQGMTMAFLTMSMCEIFHSFNMRSQRGSVIKMSFAQPQPAAVRRDGSVSRADYGGY